MSVCLQTWLVHPREKAYPEMKVSYLMYKLMSASLELDSLLLKIIWFHKPYGFMSFKGAPFTNLKMSPVRGTKCINCFREYKNIVSRILAFKKVLVSPARV